MATTKTKEKRERLPIPASKAEFNTEPFQEAGEKEMRRLREKFGEEPGFKALLKFAEWGRDAVGWRSTGRIMLSGKAER